MHSACVAISCTLLITLGACGSSQRIAVESLDHWPDVERNAAPTSSTPSVASATIRAEASTFVHSIPDWSDRNLADRDYILAGADERPAFWMSYLAFDMTGLEPEMFGLRRHGTAGSDDEGWQCSNPDFKATMTLAPLMDPPLRGRDGRAEFRVYRALQPMPVDEITWNNQPLVSDGVAGSGTVMRDEQQRDEFDVTELICTALEEGRTQLLLAVIPFDPSRDLRRRWVTASEYDPARLPSLMISTGFNAGPGVQTTRVPTAP